MDSKKASMVTAAWRQHFLDLWLWSDVVRRAEASQVDTARQQFIGFLRTWLLFVFDCFCPLFGFFSFFVWFISFFSCFLVVLFSFFRSFFLSFFLSFFICLFPCFFVFSLFVPLFSCLFVWFHLFYVFCLFVCLFVCVFVVCDFVILWFCFFVCFCFFVFSFCLFLCFFLCSFSCFLFVRWLMEPSWCGNQTQVLDLQDSCFFFRTVSQCFLVVSFVHPRVGPSWSS